MMDTRFSNEAAKRYFDTLSPAMQENITQCGMNFVTEQQLKAYAAQILGTQSAD